MPHFTLPVALVTAMAIASAAAPRDHTLVITGATVYDAVRGAFAVNQTVVARGQRIVSVGPSGAVAVPAGARVINANGKYLIPGLIDGHVHLGDLLNRHGITGDEVLPLFLAAGVTSVRDVGDEIVGQRLLARYAEATPTISPRVYTSSPLIDTDPPFHKGMSVSITSPEQVPALADRMKAWGARTLKIYVNTNRTIGRRVIEEGHKRGLVVTGHLGAYSAHDAVADGIDCLEHIWGIWNYAFPADKPEVRATMDLNNPTLDALIASVKAHKVLVGPDLVVFRNMILMPDAGAVRNHPDLRHVPARLREGWAADPSVSVSPTTSGQRRREFAKYQELTGKLFRAGVRIMAGTDTPEPGVVPGFSLHQELELLVESGMTPSAALQAATINNAKALRLEDQLGSIRKGKLADMVLLNANPLADIRNTRRIWRVIRGGIVCEPAAVLKHVPVH